MTPAAMSRPGRCDLAPHSSSAISRLANSRTSSSTSEPEHRVEHRPVRPLGERPTEVVPEAEMGTEPGPADRRLDRLVEQSREVGPGLRVDGRRRLVDLDDRRARVDELAQLGLEHRDERRGGRDPVRIDLVRARHESTGQGVRPRQRHLQRPPAPASGVAVLRDHPEPVGRLDRLEGPRGDAAGRGRRPRSDAPAAASGPRRDGGRTRP